MRTPAGLVWGLRPRDLPHWLDDELWRLELEGPTRAEDRRVAGSRGRLLQRIEAWAPPAAATLTEECAWRVRDQAVRVLRRRGQADAAAALAGAAALGEVEAWAARSPVAGLPAHAALAADAASLARGARPEAWHDGRTGLIEQSPAATAANLCFVAAHCAGLEAAAEQDAGAYEPGVARERAWQAGWLADRLELGTAVPTAP